MAKRKSYEENPSREANTAIGAGVGALVGALLGLPGAIIGAGVGAVVGASRGDTRRALDNQARCPRGTQVQTLIFSKEYFRREGATGWARRKGFRAGKVDETSSSYRIRQRPTSHFTRGSFRTIPLGDTVQAVIGCPR